MEATIRIWQTAYMHDWQLVCLLILAIICYYHSITTTKESIESRLHMSKLKPKYKVTSLCRVLYKSQVRGRAFSVAVPQAWNRLPMELRHLRSTPLFKHRLKTFLFIAELQNWTVNWTELYNVPSVNCRCRQCTRNTVHIVLCLKAVTAI